MQTSVDCRPGQRQIALCLSLSARRVPRQTGPVRSATAWTPARRGYVLSGPGHVACTVYISSRAAVSRRLWSLPRTVPGSRATVLGCFVFRRYNRIKREKSRRPPELLSASGASTARPAHTRIVARRHHRRGDCAILRRHKRLRFLDGGDDASEAALAAAKR